MANHVIIGAGGKGKRMEAGKNKVFLKLQEKEIIFHTIEKFQNNSNINSIILIISEEDKQEYEKLLHNYNLSFTKFKEYAFPGKERQYSMTNGLEKLKEINPKPKDIVLFHNGCNPFVSEQEINEIIIAAQEIGASVLAFPAKDTIRKVNEKNISIKTLNRKELWQMQTPQALQFEIAIKAFQKAKEENFLGTDDVQLAERIGIKPKIVQCSYDNIKITTPEDIELAELILKRRK